MGALERGIGALPGAANGPDSFAALRTHVERVETDRGTGEKETVHDLLVFRFASSLFEPLCGREHVDHVQITVAENIGVEARGRFFSKRPRSRTTSWGIM